MKKIVLWLLCVALAMPLLAQTGMEPKKSYLVADFNEKELNRLLEVCQLGGFEYLLVRTPFSTFGHYRWNPEFAANDKAVARMTQKAASAGIHLGLLVQPDAISENDPFFSPKYFKQFKREGQVELFSDIAEDELDIALRYNDVIQGVSSLNLILIENELISYGTIERAGELLLLHRCTRGAYGTRATAHTTKAEAYKLWDSPERYVTPDGALRDSVKKYLERRIEASGVSVVLQAGAPGQELLDGSLRVRQAEHWESSEGISKSGYLGWINIHAADQRRAATSLDDVEWLMSKAVGFDAGYGLLVDKKAIQEHGRLNEILEQIRQWDRLRCAGNLSEKQREALRDPYQDWHLEKEDDTHVKLFQWNYSRRYKCNFIEADSLLISAEPWEWKSDAPGNFGLRIQVDGKLSIINPMINTEKGLAMFPCTIKPGQSLVFDSGETAFVMDANFKKIAEVTMEGIALLPEGMSEVRFMCETMKEGDEPKVTLRYITSSLMASLGF